MTYKEATAFHLQALGLLGWTLSSPGLKTPHATSRCGSARIWFKACATLAGPRGPLGSARSLFSDRRTASTEALASSALASASFLGSR